MVKIFKSCQPLFGMAISAKCTTSAPVVLHAALRIRDNKKTLDSDICFEVEHKHDNPVTRIGYAQVHKFIVYVTTQSTKSTHLQVISQQNVAS